MASNVSREKLLFYAVAGGLGGLGAWAAAEPFMGVRSYWGRDILLGIWIGLFITAFLASIEALSVSHWRQALRGIWQGGAIGAIGGAIGLLVAEFLFDILGGLNGRIVGWAVLGAAVGLGVGTAARSGARQRNGALGGILGGALGGFCYQLLTTTFPQVFGRAIAIIILGILIGLFIGLVTELLKRGWLMVVRSASRNAREGREYPLIKPVMVIGRAEESDVGLFGDQSVLPRHAIIRQEGKAFYLSATSGAQVSVNRVPVSGRQMLKSGDRIEVGGTLFLFRERAQPAGG
jgi:tetrahydromethanopterin S-methyltransferase subunit G